MRPFGVFDASEEFIDVFEISGGRDDGVFLCDFDRGGVECFTSGRAESSGASFWISVVVVSGTSSTSAWRLGVDADDIMANKKRELV